jgi:hypothetical protein
MKLLTNLSRKTVLLMAGYVIFKWTIIICAGSYLYSSGSWRNEYFLFFPLFALIIAGIKNRKRLFRKKVTLGENTQSRQ